MVGEPGQDSLKLKVVGASDRDAAAPFVRDGEDPVDVGEVAPPLGPSEAVGDEPRRARRAVHRADDDHVVPRPDPAVVAEIAAKRPRLDLGRRWRGLGGVGIIPSEQVGHHVMDVDPFPGRDRSRREPDDLTVLPDRRPRRDRRDRDLVPQRDRFPNLDRPVLPQVEREPLGDRPGGDRHVVVPPQQDRPPAFGRRSRSRSRSHRINPSPWPFDRSVPSQSNGPSPVRKPVLRGFPPGSSPVSPSPRPPRRRG